MKIEQIGLAWSIRSKWTLITRSKQVRRGFTFFLIQLLVLLLIQLPLTLDRASRLKITRKVFSAPFQGGKEDLYPINYMTCVILKFPSKMSTCLLLSAKNDSSILVVCHEVQSVNAVCLNVRTRCSRLIAVAIHQPPTANNNVKNVFGAFSSWQGWPLSRLTEVGSLSANAKKTFNSFVGRVFANLRQKTFLPVVPKLQQNT